MAKVAWHNPYFALGLSSISPEQGKVNHLHGRGSFLYSGGETRTPEPTIMSRWVGWGVVGERVFSAVQFLLCFISMRLLIK